MVVIPLILFLKVQVSTVDFMANFLDKERVCDYDMKLLSLDTEHLTIPENEYGSSFTMSSAEFQKICRDLSLLGESLTIEINKEYVKFSAEGEVGTGNIIVKPSAAADDDSVATIIEVQAPVSNTLSAKYLNMFTKATTLSKAVTVSMSGQNPVLIEYKISDVGHIAYYLAPKIGDE